MVGDVVREGGRNQTSWDLLVLVGKWFILIVMGSHWGRFDCGSHVI